jgi:hypothetical protein
MTTFPELAKALNSWIILIAEFAIKKGAEAFVNRG